MVLAARVAPEGDKRLNRDQILDSQQDPKQGWAHEETMSRRANEMVRESVLSNQDILRTHERKHGSRRI
jgi:hypothetical protein